ncbi:MAG: anthranilate synthase component I [Candidatus Methylomirabilis sp.]|nr:anthranilate synthase component I [Deltaproteobacteria bacterium]
MDFPDRTQFLRLAERGNLVPVCRTMLADLETPVAALLKLGAEETGFLFESVEGGEKWGRYSILGTDPKRLYRSDAQWVSVTDRRTGKTERRPHQGLPVSFVRDALAGYRPVPVEGLPPFLGGCVGYIGYDMVRYIERLPDRNPDPLGLPEMMLMLCDSFVVFDNARQQLQVVALADLTEEPDPDAAYALAVAKIDALAEKLRRPLEHPKPEDFSGAPLRIEANRSREDYLGAVEKAKEYIRAGDVIQAVLSVQFQAEYRGRSVDLYRALRTINPSPYLFYCSFPECKLIGSSPEVLVRLQGDDITVRPIAGTRPRAADPLEDEELAEGLLKDPKETAEHGMLVDLGRNDVGRVARIGSVSVDEFMVIERYSHVMHIVSNVVGKRAEGQDAYTVLEACFPAGTLSGAPKIRAMEIIDELEPTRRGPYGGSVGYFGFGGNMDMCIAIRTMVRKGDRLYFQAGAGIVYDSVPEREFEECVNKAKAMARAIEVAREGLDPARARKESKAVWSA